MAQAAATPLCRDAVIVIPGIMGSELVDPRTGDRLWGLSVAANLRMWATGDGLRRLAVTDAERAGRAGRVVATALLRWPAAVPVLSGVEPYTALVAGLHRVLPHPDALLPFPYDWRLSVPFNAARLAEAAEAHLYRWRRHPEGTRDARLVLVAHSMGGLVARYFTAMLGGAHLVRRTVAVGTPHQGAVKAAYLLNSGRGAPVWLPHRRLRELAVTLPGVHDLLPSYRCVEQGGAGCRRLTAADVADLGGDPELAEQAFRTHGQLINAADPGLRTLVGVRQPTMQSMRLAAGVVTARWYLLEDGLRTDHRGDGTVYVESALGGTEPVHTPAQSHAGLARSPDTITAVAELLARRRLGAPQGGAELCVEVPDVVAVGEAWTIAVTTPGRGAPGCRVEEATGGRQIAVPQLLPVGPGGTAAAPAPAQPPVDGSVPVPGTGDGDGDPREGRRWSATVRSPRAGVYRVEVKGAGAAAVTFLVMAADRSDLDPAARP